VSGDVPRSLRVARGGVRSTAPVPARNVRRSITGSSDQPRPSSDGGMVSPLEPNIAGRRYLMATQRTESFRCRPKNTSTSWMLSSWASAFPPIVAPFPRRASGIRVTGAYESKL